MAGSTRKVAGWGNLSVALNKLLRAGTITGFKTARLEGDGPVGVDVYTVPGADQAEVVRSVREALPDVFANA